MRQGVEDCVCLRHSHLMLWRDAAGNAVDDLKQVTLHSTSTRL